MYTEGKGSNKEIVKYSWVKIEPQEQGQKHFDFYPQKI